MAEPLAEETRRPLAASPHSSIFLTCTPLKFLFIQLADSRQT